ncbi:MAG: EAL domain-containing protein [Rhodocyclaceae bacterium]|jgi:diguanylate cyclase (GGDEF)-like protein|nr:EAL domain-containing protein [Rhodocyclaceae bacterium]
MVIPVEGPFLGHSNLDQPGSTELACRILIVDDDAALRRTLPHVLAQAGRVFDECGSVGEAISRLEGQFYDLVLLDYRLPDATGLTLLDWLQGRQREEAVVMISGEDAIDAAIGALRRGADDFVRKPYHVAQLQRAVQSALHKSALERANRAMSQRLRASERLHRYLVESSPDLIFTLDPQTRFTYINPRIETLLGYERNQLLNRPFATILLPDDVPRVEMIASAPENAPASGYNLELRLCRNRAAWPRASMGHITVALNALPMYAKGEGDGPQQHLGTYGVARDISERKRAEEIISFQAYHDQLTRLPNRILFKDRLELAIAQAQRRSGSLAVMFVDIDRFKLVNDSYGHSEGDLLLQGVATRLKDALRRGDTLARLGGDEFTILLPDIGQPEDAEVIARKILDTLQEPFALTHGDFRVSASVGIALYPRDGSTAEALTQHADVAMYQVKRSGRNGFRFFDSDLNSHYRQRIELENDLRTALERDEFELYYQPQVSVSQKKVVAVEALLRWHHPVHGLLGPAAFIQVAEEVGLISGISRWVVDRASRQLAAWHRAGHRDLRLSFNLSPHDFDRDDIVESIRGSLSTHQVPPASMDVEITESVMMQDTDAVTAKVRQLRNAGLGISIDDFGTGYSALAYLQKFPITSLKIDRSFVRDLDAPGTHPIISAITGIARGFGLRLVAEGVETAAQARILRGLGCDCMQGFYFSRPVDASTVAPLFEGMPAQLFA